MFVLYPDGKGGSGAGGPSPFWQKVMFVGQLGLYFCGVRIAYVFFGAGLSETGPKALTN